MPALFVIRCLRCLMLHIVDAFPQACDCGARTWQVNQLEPQPYRISQSDRRFLRVLKIDPEPDLQLAPSGPDDD